MIYGERHPCYPLGHFQDRQMKNIFENYEDGMRGFFRKLSLGLF